MRSTPAPAKYGPNNNLANQGNVLPAYRSKNKHTQRFNKSNTPKHHIICLHSRKYPTNPADQKIIVIHEVIHTNIQKHQNTAYQ